MYLDLFRNIKDFFSGLFGKLSFDNLMILIFGIVFGFILCFCIYMIFVFTSLKTEEKRVIKNSASVDFEKIDRLIRSAKNQFIEDSANKNTGQKLTDIKDISWNLINDIAREYFPDSAYPIYELSLDELMVLNHYITNRIDSLFKGPVLKPFKKVRIAYILKIIDMKKKIDENKAMKTANRLKTPWKAALTVLNIFNPVFWVKKLMISTTLIAVTNKIGVTIIEVVGEETNKVYSKSVFNVEKNTNTEIEKTIMELEQMVNEE